MRNIGLGRLLRMSRIRLGERQVDVGKAARLSAPTVCRHELGNFASVDAVQRHAAALDLRLDLRLVGRGGELNRTRDDEHAVIVDALARAFGEAGFECQPEVSFNRWGDRGRIDLAAFDQRSGFLVLVEVKGELADLQDTLGPLDVKERVASAVAMERGWMVRTTTTVLAVAATDGNRHIVKRHAGLFSGFLQRTFRGGAVPVHPGVRRFLLWVPPGAAGRRAWLAGRRRVRRRARRDPRGRGAPPIVPGHGLEPVEGSRTSAAVVPRSAELPRGER